jgi:3-polyprenyl-4-hydroxybenzoate decarboxylase
MNFDAIFNLLKDLHVEVLEEISQIFHMPDEIGDKIVDNSVKRVLGIFGIEPVY